MHKTLSTQINMKILAGKWRGITLNASLPNNTKIPGYKPTTSLVRESLFNILLHNSKFQQIRNNMHEATFLDLCSGSGSCGFEAMSRGFKSAVFVDASFHTLKLVDSNAQKLNLRKNIDYTTLQCDLMKKIPALNTHFSIIYIDPPYNIAKEMLNHLIPEAINLLAPNGVLIYECSSKTHITMQIPDHYVATAHNYGDTNLTFISTNTL